MVYIGRGEPRTALYGIAKIDGRILIVRYLSDHTGRFCGFDKSLAHGSSIFDHVYVENLCLDDFGSTI